MLKFKDEILALKVLADYHAKKGYFIVKNSYWSLNSLKRTFNYKSD
jgi:hypothetical protein